MTKKGWALIVGAPALIASTISVVTSCSVVDYNQSLAIFNEVENNINQMPNLWKRQAMLASDFSVEDIKNLLSGIKQIGLNRVDFDFNSVFNNNESGYIRVKMILTRADGNQQTKEIRIRGFKTVASQRIEATYPQVVINQYLNHYDAKYNVFKVKTNKLTWKLKDVLSLDVSNYINWFKNDHNGAPKQQQLPTDVSLFKIDQSYLEANHLVYETDRVEPLKFGNFETGALIFKMRMRLNQDPLAPGNSVYIIVDGFSDSMEIFQKQNWAQALINYQNPFKKDLIKTINLKGLTNLKDLLNYLESDAIVKVDDSGISLKSASDNLEWKIAGFEVIDGKKLVLKINLKINQWSSDQVVELNWWN